MFCVILIQKRRKVFPIMVQVMTNAECEQELQEK